VQKTYLAWTSGALPKGAKLGEMQRWQCRLLRGKKRAYVHAAGKEAVTEATPLFRDKDCTLWLLRPLTGRPHQLRVELARRDSPILGDSLYGSTVPWASGIALRAVALDLSALAGREELALPATLSLTQGSHLETGKAWLRAVASRSGHSTHSACPADGISSGAG
jgi:tRNA pseudouridine32 synthase/23S rRNA pseudouridine746 synthase